MGRINTRKETEQQESGRIMGEAIANVLINGPKQLAAEKAANETIAKSMVATAVLENLKAEERAMAQKTQALLRAAFEGKSYKGKANPELEGE